MPLSGSRECAGHCGVPADDTVPGPGDACRLTTCILPGTCHRKIGSAGATRCHHRCRAQRALRQVGTCNRQHRGSGTDSTDPGACARERADQCRCTRPAVQVAAGDCLSGAVPRCGDLSVLYLPASLGVLDDPATAIGKALPVFVFAVPLILIGIADLPVAFTLIGFA